MAEATDGAGDDRFRLTFSPTPELWCSCGKNTEVPSEGGYILGIELARLRADHRCGPPGSPWNKVS